MAKKSRRARRRASTAAQPVRLTRPTRPVATDAKPKEVDFAAEYFYVIEDLRRIGITAVALLALLIALAMIIS
jgi:hypothetical protein